MCCCLCLPVSLNAGFCVVYTSIWLSCDSEDPRALSSWADSSHLGGTPPAHRAACAGQSEGMWLLLCIRKGNSTFETVAVVLVGLCEHRNSVPEGGWKGKWQARNASSLIVLATCKYPAGIKAGVGSCSEGVLKMCFYAHPFLLAFPLLCSPSENPLFFFRVHAPGHSGSNIKQTLSCVLIHSVWIVGRGWVWRWGIQGMPLELEWNKHVSCLNIDMSRIWT